MALLLACMVTLGATAIMFVMIRALQTYQARKRIRGLAMAGLPMPEHHLLFGHLPIMQKRMKNFPRNCVASATLGDIAKDFPNGVFYLDFAPFDKPTIIVTSANTATQVQKLTQLQKTDFVVTVMNTLCGGTNLFTMSGHVGKLWRNTFNKGFSVAYVHTLASVVAREVQVFAAIIDREAKRGEPVRLVEPVTRLTVDVITSIGMDARLGYQEQNSTLSSIMMSQLQWGGFTASRDLWKVLNPVRPFLLWYNKRQMHKYIGSQIDRRYFELAQHKGNGSLHEKSALTMALQDSATTTWPDGKAAEKLESARKATLVSQIMLFLIAGQDTTSTTITYCFHEIYTSPTALKRIRAEHSEVFGTDSSPAQIVSAIEKSPDRLNDLPYTSAIIKETLRLHPPASIVRKGESGVTLTDDEGNIFPTEGCNIWVVHLAMQRDPKYFVEPDSFIPERWLAEPGDRLYPTKGAWRPFETGQRNCLGQPLAMLMIKISLLMVVRSFDIAEAYDEVAPERSSKDGANAKRDEDKGHRYGKAYPVYDLGLSIFPHAGYPCRITAVNA